MRRNRRPLTEAEREDKALKSLLKMHPVELTADELAERALELRELQTRVARVVLQEWPVAVKSGSRTRQEDVCGDVAVQCGILADWLDNPWNSGAALILLGITGAQSLRVAMQKYMEMATKWGHRPEDAQLAWQAAVAAWTRGAKASQAHAALHERP